MITVDEIINIHEMMCDAAREYDEQIKSERKRNGYSDIAITLTDISLVRGAESAHKHMQRLCAEKVCERLRKKDTKDTVYELSKDWKVEITNIENFGFLSGKPQKRIRLAFIDRNDYDSPTSTMWFKSVDELKNLRNAINAFIDNEK